MAAIYVFILLERLQHWEAQCLSRLLLRWLWTDEHSKCYVSVRWMGCWWKVYRWGLARQENVRYTRPCVQAQSHIRVNDYWSNLSLLGKIGHVLLTRVTNITTILSALQVNIKYIHTYIRTHNQCMLLCSYRTFQKQVLQHALQGK